MEGHQVNHEPRLFGEELRRKRLTAGLSLAQLAHIVHYSKAQRSKVERGIKTPSRDLARLCDAALDADGELASLASPEPASRRQVLAAGALAAPAICHLPSASTIAPLPEMPSTGNWREFFALNWVITVNSGKPPTLPS
jgi:transcriptional regulator with XRE-family HTH domain